jgi:hypothetical protein
MLNAEYPQVESLPSRGRFDAGEEESRRDPTLLDEFKFHRLLLLHCRSSRDGFQLLYLE